MRGLRGLQHGYRLSVNCARQLRSQCPSPSFPAGAEVSIAIPGCSWAATSLLSTSGFASSPPCSSPAGFHSDPASQRSQPEAVEEILEEPEARGERQHSEIVDPFIRENQVAESGPLAVYVKGRRGGKFRKDPRQEATTLMLQRLYDDVKLAHDRRHRPGGLTLVDNFGQSQGKQAWWQGLGSFLHSKAEVQVTPPIAGLYMHGGVGVGKTMLMDMFADCVPPEFKLRRIHFHDFMLDVHSRLRNQAHQQDPLTKVADQIADSWRILCLDEFFVNDVADAAILNRLFSQLWARGLVLVTTSNRHPDALYENGLQRYLFLPFIERIKKECIVHDMASTTDYRRLAHHRRGLYFVAGDRDTELRQRFVELAAGHPIVPADVPIMMGRTLHAPQTAGTACLFDFETLCGRPLAASDYIGLAGKFDTLALAGVPVFTPELKTHAYRFVTLIDVLYEHRVRLICSADAMPIDLFRHVLTQSEAAAAAKTHGGKDEPELLADDNLGFAKDRVISRLTEMQSAEYLMSHARLHAPHLILALQEATKAEILAAATLKKPAH